MEFTGLPYNFRSHFIPVYFKQNESRIRGERVSGKGSSRKGSSQASSRRELVEGQNNVPFSLFVILLPKGFQQKRVQQSINLRQGRGGGMLSLEGCPSKGHPAKRPAEGQQQQRHCLQQSWHCLQQQWHCLQQQWYCRINILLFLDQTSWHLLLTTTTTTMTTSILL